MKPFIFFNAFYDKKINVFFKKQSFMSLLCLIWFKKTLNSSYIPYIVQKKQSFMKPFIFFNAFYDKK